MNKEEEEEEYTIRVGEAVFHFGKSCPAVSSMFFEKDQDKKEEKEQE